MGWLASDPGWLMVGAGRDSVVGFSIRIAPGVRVRASSRGVRTSLGPRVARVHIGAGSTGISTGVGPVGFYQSLGGGGRRPVRTARAVGQSLAQAQVEQAHDLVQAMRAVQDLHRVQFEPSRRPVAPPLRTVEPHATDRRHLKAALAGVSFWDFASRRQAKAAAAEATQRDLAQDAARRAQGQQARQAELDRTWALLNDNDSEVVHEVLTAAFEDNDAPAAVVGVEDGTAHVVVLVPDAEVLPDRYPTTTPAGNLSLRRMSKTDRSALYRTLVAGHVLVTVKEACAVVPRLAGVRAVAIRIPRHDAYGKAVVEPLLACHVRRDALNGVDWEKADSTSVLVDVSDELVFNLKGATKTLTPINLVTESDIAEMVAAVDLEDLVGGGTQR